MLFDKNCLVFPVTRAMACKKVLFYENGNLVFDLDVPLDLTEPCAYAYYDVTRFKGRNIEIKTDPEIGYIPVLADQEDDSRFYTEKYRPQFHFAPKFGWLNDPNGLIKVGDVWHLFFQFNPCNWTWGNMHWGHAVSGDLFHWRQLPTALFPDETGTMYSGSAIADTANVSGLGDGKNVPVLFYYTAAGNGSLLSAGVPFTQCLAYSTDGGMTLKKYENNPIIPHIAGANRDPKVIWCAPLGKYLMALYLDDNDFTLLSSADLLHWERFQNLTIPDEMECPNMFPLTADDGREKWCIFGVSTRYLVGEFVCGQFVPEQPVKRISLDGPNKAGQIFSGLEGGRQLLLLWQNIQLGSDPICGQMSVPLDLTLKKTADGYAICALPADEIKAIWKNTYVTTGEKDSPVVCSLNVGGLDMTVTFPYVSGKKFNVCVYGQTFTFDTDAGELRLGNRKMPITRTKTGEGSARMIIDRCSAELFTDGGLHFMTVACTQDLNLHTLTITGDAQGVSVTAAVISNVWGK